MKTLRASRDLLLPYLVAALLLCGVGMARSQEVPLQIKGGDAKVVKIERKIVVVKIVVDEHTVVSTFPFFVEAPSGAGLYFWSAPAGVKTTDQGDKLRIDSAPNGPLVVSVKAVTGIVGPDKMTVIYKTIFGSTTVDIGSVDPPKPPVPPDPPAPDTPLVQALKAALAKDIPADKGLVPNIVTACVKASAAANDRSLTLVKQVNDVFVTELRQTVFQGCPNLRAAITAHLNANLLRTVDGALDDATRANVSSVFNALAAGLKVIQ